MRQTLTHFFRIRSAETAFIPGVWQSLPTFSVRSTSVDTASFAGPRLRESFELHRSGVTLLEATEPRSWGNQAPWDVHLSESVEHPFSICMFSKEGESPYGPRPVRYRVCAVRAWYRIFAIDQQDHSNSSRDSIISSLHHKIYNMRASQH